MRKIFVLLVGLSVPTSVVAQPDIISGPVTADVLKNYDGDTFTARAYVWPGVYVRTKVRLRKVDTPEIRGKCPQEKALAQKAKEFVNDQVTGKLVQLTQIERGKYAQRVLANVEYNGKSLAEELLKHDLARPYDGGGRKSWCDRESSESGE